MLCLISYHNIHIWYNIPTLKYILYVMIFQHFTGVNFPGKRKIIWKYGTLQKRRSGCNPLGNLGRYTTFVICRCPGGVKSHVYYICIPQAGFGAINTRHRVYRPVLMQDKENVPIYIYKLLLYVCTVEVVVLVGHRVSSEGWCDGVVVPIIGLIATADRIITARCE